MNIVHISTTDKIGGASIAAFRLNEAMRKNGITSRMLVSKKVSVDNSVHTRLGLSGKMKYYLFYYISYLVKIKLLRSSYPFSMGFLGTKISKLSLIKDADIIYIHWINNGYLSIKEMGRILSLGKPVILYMHDMWFITGGCHHSFSCDKYALNCNNCPIIRNKYLKFVSRCVLNSKSKYLKGHENLHIVTPSVWLANCVKQSSLFCENSITVIPNTLNTDLFKPCDKQTARHILNLPLEKKLLLFAADGNSSNPYKGWGYLKEALLKMNIPDLEIVVFGNSIDFESEQEIPYKIHSMGYLHDESSLILLYNAVDVYVTPSLAESFGQTVFEAQACGASVVGFNVGGIPDLIKHLKTGYLVKYMDSDDLASGIKWAIEHSGDMNFVKYTRDFIKNNFSYDIVVDKHGQMFANTVGLI